jgi:polyhydroxyalkanoate synthase
MEHSRPTTSINHLDRLIHAAEGRMTAGISPTSMLLAYMDWAIHLANSPGKQGELVKKAIKKDSRFLSYVAKRLAHFGPELEGECCIEPLPQDKRFSSEGWRELPFSFYAQSFLLTQQWWHNAITGVHGVSKHHEDVVLFATRQLLDMFSPSNFLLTNPDVLKVTQQEGGMNLVRGMQNFLEDWDRNQRGVGPVGIESFQVGVNLATTAGKVIYKNRLIELIQYSPTTEKVYAEPILFVPAWIMKYYIMDLSEQNSMVKFLVDQGHTVFMISWKNPTESDRDLSLEDYIDLGVMAALKEVTAILPDEKVHTVGYCLGGTLLALAATALAREGSTPIGSMTLLAAQTDFSEAGELMLFTDHSQVAYLEDMMWDQGYLDTKQMAGAFQLLRSNDLIWSKVLHDYLMGKRAAMNDLMAWNSDATRMPYRMHSEYLEQLFMNNDFSEHRYRVHGKTVSLGDIRCPLFVVGAEKDHVAPWESVYKVKSLTRTDVTFLLTSGGHNAGIISEPGHPHRHYRVSLKRRGDKYIAPDKWLETTEVKEGSWWMEWEHWLVNIDKVEKISPPEMGGKGCEAESLIAAPGHYVLEH